MKISLSFWSVLAVWTTMASTPASAETRMQVAVGSTPVYTQPSADAQRAGKVSSGEILFVSRVEGDWAAISAPDRMDVWLNKDFIEGNRVIAKTIQVRAGPGIQHDVVGIVGSRCARDASRRTRRLVQDCPSVFGHLLGKERRPDRDPHPHHPHSGSGNRANTRPAAARSGSAGKGSRPATEGSRAAIPARGSGT